MGKGQGSQKNNRRPLIEPLSRDLDIEARIGRDITNLSRPHYETMSNSSRNSSSSPKIRGFKHVPQLAKQKIQHKAIEIKKKAIDRPLKIPSPEPKESKIDKNNSKKTQLVSPFHREILLYLKQKELADKAQMTGGQSSSRKGKIRAERINWIIKTHLEFSLKEETCLLSLNLFDRCINHLSSTEWQLLAVACMRIASKYEEILINELHDYQKVTNNRFTKQQINATELLVLQVVQFNISQTCHTSVLERIRLLQGLDSSFTDICLFICKICQVEAALASENQYLLSVAIGAIVSGRVFLKPATEATLKSLFVIASHIVRFSAPLKQAITASVLNPLNPARRVLVQRFGMGYVKKMEGQLLH